MAMYRHNINISDHKHQQLPNVWAKNLAKTLIAKILIGMHHMNSMGKITLLASLGKEES